MIVRTYARRNRCAMMPRGFADPTSFEGDGETSDGGGEVENSFHHDIYGLNFSSQDSSPWSLDPEFGAPDRPPSPRKSKRPPPKRPDRSALSNGTSTLMEAQEFGEMMQHVDEVNFALDGLRPGLPLQIRRSSLLSLLSICATSAQRRLLRTRGMEKTVLDAIIGLSTDDSSSNLAAATLFFVLASDGLDEHLLDSPSCIRFLLKLLSTSSIGTVEGKAPSIGSRLLALHRGPGKLGGFTEKIDASSNAIILKVHEILLSCKEIKPGNQDVDGTQIRRPELSPKWIALLTIEKACISTVSLEDTSGTVRRVGGNFKERLRDLGGLDTVFNVIASCHSIMKQGWLTNIRPLSGWLKDGVAVESVVLLLKCLKIMENAAFLSKDNQDHLLGMDSKFNSEGSSMSFVGLTLSAIKILSGLSLLQNSCTHRHNKSNDLLHGDNSHYCHSSKVQLKCRKGEHNGVSSCCLGESFCSTEKAVNKKKVHASQKRQRLCTPQSEYCMSGSLINEASTSEVDSSRNGDNFPTIACNGTLRCSNGELSMCVNPLRIDSIGVGKRSHVIGGKKHYILEDNQDPFAFDEDVTEPSKWELLSKKSSTSQTLKRMDTVRELDDKSDLALVTRTSGFINEENQASASSCLSFSEEDMDLLDDCLLTAVKVLMNLTNDNPTGCQQIASCGGLDTMMTLISSHFPFFDSSSSTDCQKLEDISFSQLSIDSNHKKAKHLKDQELDFLVAILGLLVNLVEKDSENRSRLAAATVPLPKSGGMKGKDSHRDVISLLCSIFLANQGAGEATEGGQLEWSDEDAILQGEREAEQMIVEAYSALLLAFLSTESLHVRDAIADCLPDGNLEVLIPVLERFVAFHLTLNMISSETHAAVSEVIESCRGS